MITSGRAAPAAPPDRQPGAGLTLVECLVALALLGLILTSSLTLLEYKRRYLAEIADRLHALHAIEKELEYVAATPVADLAVGEQPFLSDPSELAGLPGVQSGLTVAATEIGRLRRVRAWVVWGKGRQKRESGELLVAEGGPR